MWKKEKKSRHARRKLTFDPNFKMPRFNIYNQKLAFQTGWDRNAKLNFGYFVFKYGIWKRIKNGKIERCGNVFFFFDKSNVSNYCLHPFWVQLYFSVCEPFPAFGINFPSSSSFSFSYNFLFVNKRFFFAFAFIWLIDLWYNNCLVWFHFRILQILRNRFFFSFLRWIVVVSIHIWWICGLLRVCCGIAVGWRWQKKIPEKCCCTFVYFT